MDALNTSQIRLNTSGLIPDQAQHLASDTRSAQGLSVVQEVSQENSSASLGAMGDTLDTTPVRAQPQRAHRVHRLRSHGLSTTLNPADPNAQGVPNVAETGQLGTMAELGTFGTRNY